MTEQVVHTRQWRVYDSLKTFIIGNTLCSATVYFTVLLYLWGVKAVHSVAVHGFSANMVNDTTTMCYTNVISSQVYDQRTVLNYVINHCKSQAS